MGISDPLLQASDLAIHRGARLLLRNISLTVTPGQALWVTGPNGIGKSTLLRALAGLQPPLQGAVVCTDDLLYLPSAPGLDAALTIIENLDWWSRLHGVRRAQVAESLQTWGLTAQADLPISKLSQGQAQRAALARLSLSSAQLWLLDEPLAHLDAAGHALWQTVAEAHLQAGGALVAATHAVGALPNATILDLSQC